jgi:hypothetical protein
MSKMLLENHFSHDIQKVIAISVVAAISDSVIHGVWLADSGNIFTKSTLLIHFNTN